MTNGEKIKALFPNICITYDEDMVVIDGFPASVVSNIEFNKAWWNAEYRESTTQEPQAESDKFDAAFQDGYNNGYAQARFDYEQKPVIDKINKMKSEIADSLEFWDYSPNNNPLARDMLETITNFWGDIREVTK